MIPKTAVQDPHNLLLSLTVRPICPYLSVTSPFHSKIVCLDKRHHETSGFYRWYDLPYTPFDRTHIVHHGFRGESPSLLSYDNHHFAWDYTHLHDTISTLFGMGPFSLLVEIYFLVFLFSLCRSTKKWPNPTRKETWFSQEHHQALAPLSQAIKWNAS